MTPKKLTKEQLAHLEEIRNSYQELSKPEHGNLKVILSDPEGVIASKEERAKRWTAEKLKAKRFSLVFKEQAFKGVYVIRGYL